MTSKGYAKTFYLDSKSKNLLDQGKRLFQLKNDSEYIRFLLENAVLFEDPSSKMEELINLKNKQIKELENTKSLINECERRLKIQSKIMPYLEEEKSRAVSILKRKINEKVSYPELERIAKYWSLLCRTDYLDLLALSGLAKN